VQNADKCLMCIVMRLEKLFLSMSEGEEMFQMTLNERLGKEDKSQLCKNCKSLCDLKLK
jgi:hypothetical protein